MTTASQLQLLANLEEIATRLGYTVRYEVLANDAEVGVHSGRCLVDGKPLLIIEYNLPLLRKIDFLLSELRKENLDDIFLSPSLRELLGDRF